MDWMDIATGQRGEPINDLISRQAAIDELVRWGKIPDYSEGEKNIIACAIGMLSSLPSAEPEIIRCKDCFYGYLYSGVYNGTTCSWVECKNPDGLNRDVSPDGYCSAAIRR